MQILSRRSEWNIKSVGRRSSLWWWLVKTNKYKKICAHKVWKCINHVYPPTLFQPLNNSIEIDLNTKANQSFQIGGAFLFFSKLPTKLKFYIMSKETLANLRCLHYTYQKAQIIRQKNENERSGVVFNLWKLALLDWCQLMAIISDFNVVSLFEISLLWDDELQFMALLSYVYIQLLCTENIDKARWMPLVY